MVVKIIVLTEIGRVKVFGAVKSNTGKVRDHVLTDSGKHALSLGHYVNVTEHCKYSGTGRMYRTNDRSTAVGEFFE
jgi:hypothetical protein